MPKTRLLITLIGLLFFSNFSDVYSQFSCGSVRSTRCSAIPNPICNASSVGVCAYSLPDPNNYNTDILAEIPNDLCNQRGFDLQNPNWFKSVAASSNISFVLDVQFCNGNPGEEGVQYAILRDCGDLEVISCSTLPTEGNNNVEVSGLRVGETFYILIDGYSGSICTYSLRSLKGFGTTNIEDIEDIDIGGSLDDEFCSSNTPLDFIPVNGDGDPIRGAGEVVVTLTNDLTSEVIIDDEVYTGNSFALPLDELGTFTIAVAASNECSTAPVTFSKTYSVIQPEDQTLDVFQFCLSSFGNEALFPTDPRYLGPPISQVDIDNLEVRHIVTDDDGCSFTQIVPLEPLGGTDIGTLVEVACGPAPVDVMGTLFQNSVSDFLFTIPNGGVGGCDSLVNLDLTIVDVSGTIEQTSCPDGSVSLSFQLSPTADTTQLDSVFYRWIFTDVIGTEISSMKDDATGPVVNTDGAVTLIIIQWKNNTVCTLDNLMANVAAQTTDINLRCTALDTETVRYEWDDAPNAAQYILVNNGDTINRQLENSYTFENLPPNTETNLIVHARGNSKCPDFIAGPVTCQATSCPPLAVTIDQGAQSICLDGGTSIIDFNVTIENHSGNGNGIWESDGIIDLESGVFDVSQSGAGSYSVRYMYVVDGVCTYQSNPVNIDIQNPILVDFDMPGSVCTGESITATLIDFSSENIYNWDIEGNPVINQLDEINSSFSWSTAGTHLITLSMEQPDCSTMPLSRPITVLPSLDPIQISCTPSADRVTFEWNIDPNVREYQIFDDNGVMLISQSTGSYIIDQLSLDQSVSIEVVGIANNGCNPVSSELSTCATSSCAQTNFSIVQASGQHCIDDDATTEIQFSIDSPPANGSGRWIVNNGGIISTTGLFVFSENISGEYIISYEFDSAEEPCSYQSQNQVNIELISSAPFSYSLSNNRACQDEAVVLNITNFDPLVSLNITGTNGATVNKIAEDRYEISWIDVGDQEIIIETTNGLCQPSNERFEVEITPGTEALVINCTPSLDQIDFSWNDIPCADSYDILIDGVFVVNQTESTYQASNLAEGQNITLEVNALGDCACGLPTRTLDCTAGSCPSIPLILDIPMEACSGDDVSIGAMLGGEDVLSQGVWTPNVVTAQDMLDLNLLTNGSNQINFSIEIDGCQYVETATIEIFNKPSIDFDIEYSNCSDSVTVNVLSQGLPSDIEILIDNRPFDTDSFQLPFGEYQLQLTDVMTLCSSDTMLIIEAVVMNPDPFSIDVIDEVLVGDTLVYNLIEDGDNLTIDSVIWTVNDATNCEGMSCSYFVDSLGVVPDMLELCAHVFFDSSCDQIICTTVSVDQVLDVAEDVLFYLPNVFHCGSDNPANQQFRIFSNRDDVIITAFSIHDRNGSTVHRATAPDPLTGYFDWDGTGQDGSPQEVGVYMYRLLYKDSVGRDRRVFGSITLVK